MYSVSRLHDRRDPAAHIYCSAYFCCSIKQFIRLHLHSRLESGVMGRMLEAGIPLLLLLPRVLQARLSRVMRHLSNTASQLILAH